MKQVILILPLLCLYMKAPAQTIQMNFPHFAGKTYDLIIFQGDKQEKIIQDTIPANGKFTLRIPTKYAPYTGMSRWLITGTKEGGGLDMVIHGRDFSVECKEVIPSGDNIIYKGNDEVGSLNTHYKEEQKIFAKADAMTMALKSYALTDKNYKIFEQEYQEQAKAYNDFQARLKKEPSYAARFLNIVNFTQGIGTQLLDTEEKKAGNIANYTANELDWETLYTSGHWTGIISGWIGMHTQVLKNPFVFAQDFSKIEKRIRNKELFTDFAGKVSYFLTQQGRDDLIGAIAPIVNSSGKITKYEGSMLAYKVGVAGTQAPDLTFTEYLGDPADHNHNTTVLKSKEFASVKYQKTLLIFYESGCGPCENLLQQIPGNYENLKAKGIRIIALSADTDEKVFKEKSKDFLWKDTYCDLEGKKGINFKNYGVAGTPTIFLIDKGGKIEARMAGLDEVLEKLK